MRPYGELAGLEAAGSNFIVPFDQSPSLLPYPCDLDRSSLPMLTESWRMQERPLGKLVKAASAHGIAPASDCGPTSNARLSIEKCLPQSRQTRWSWCTDALTETAGSGLGGAAAFCCTVASVLNTC